jgi:hypothetical protein
MGANLLAAVVYVVMMLEQPKPFTQPIIRINEHS